MRSGYRNICKRHMCEEDMEFIHTLDEETIEKLKLLSVKHEEWIVELNKSSNGQFSLVKVPYSEARTTVDGRRLVFEIIVDVNRSKITIRTHGQPLILEELSNKLQYSRNSYSFSGFSIALHGQFGRCCQ